MTWTEKQQDAIDARGRSVIVSAAAGSGKTAVLVERLTEILLDEENKVPADKLAVVTFTNDAALEIKKRLRSTISSKAAENPDNQWLREQQILLRKAKISTIHTFCYSIIRDYYDGDKFTPMFRVLDETESKLIKSDAIDKVLNKWHENNKDKINYLIDTICDEADDQIEEMILKMDSFLASVTFKEVWIKRVSESYSKPYKESDYYFKNREHLLNKLKDIKMIVQNALDNSFGIYSDDPYRVSTIINGDMGILKILENNLYENKNNPITEFKRYPGVKKNLVDLEMKEKVKNIRDSYKAIIKSDKNNLTDVISKFVLDSEREYKIQGKVFDIIKDIYFDYRNELLELKSEKNSLSFDDAEEMVIDILCNHDENGNIFPLEISEKISDQYDVIMIDEFQDSNNKQDIIFKLLSKNREINGNELKYGSNVFIVGDVKQSIYSFRQANPENFMNIISTSTFYSKENTDKIQKIYLNNNFRSSEKVIDFVNSFFSEMMSLNCGEVDYNENEYLYKGSLSFEKADELGVDCKTEIIAFAKDSKDKEQKNIEELLVAEKIYNMIKNKEIVFDKDGTARPCRPSDFCILIRKKDMAKGFKSALEKYGIAVEGEAEEGYLQSEEIAVLINMLKIINNPEVDTAMASVLMSPMFMFTSDDMLELRGAENVTKNDSLISCLHKSLEDESNVSEIVKIKCRDFFEKFNELRNYSVYNNITMLVQKIYETTGYSSVAGYNMDGAKKRSNLRLMFHYTKEYSEKNGSSASLLGFLMYIEKINKNNSNFKQASSEENDAVYIKTNHGSKGLEYPFVFIVKTDSEFSTQDKKDFVAFSNDYSMSFAIHNKEEYSVSKPTEFKRINDLKSDKQKSEEMRLFYVALTRARQKLFISVNISKIAKEAKASLPATKEILGTAKAALESNKTLDWLYLYLNDKTVFFDSLTSEENHLFKVSFFDKYVEAEIEVEEPEKTEYIADELKIEKIETAIDFEYESEQYKIEARKTVSEIIESQNLVTEVQEIIRRPEKWKRPDFMLETGKMKSNERGTAIHKFMQYLNFENAEKNLEAERERLIKNGFITPAIDDVMTDDYVNGFLASDIYSMLSETRKENIYREKQILIKMKDIYSRVPLKILENYKDTETMLKGVMDLYFKDKDGNVILVDYKTDSLDKEDEFISRYSEQLNIYAAALNCIESQKVKCMYIYSFKLGKSIEVPFTE